MKMLFSPDYHWRKRQDLAAVRLKAAELRRELAAEQAERQLSEHQKASIRRRRRYRQTGDSEL